MSDCTELEPKLTAYLYDEASDEERAACEKHLASCEACRAAVENHRLLNGLLAKRSGIEMTPDLLVECRQRLDEALDRDQLGWRGLLHNLLNPAPRTLASRAAAAMTLVLFGFGLGWMLRTRTPRLPAASGVSRASAGVSPTELGNMQINDITQVSPDPSTGEVHIALNAERHVTLEGSIDDPHIQQLLVNAMKGYQNPGIRRDTLDALRTRSDNPLVRQALLYEVSHDPNAGVRLEALKTTEKMDWGPDLEQTLVDTVEHEKNPGVRFAAIDMLSNHALKEKDTALLPTLERLSARDPDNYVRLKCAVAVRSLTGN